MLRLVIFASLLAVVFSASLPKGLVPMLDGRIVGGETTTIDKYPYQVAFLNHGSLRCGGTIISSRFIVTAAHCTSGTTASSVTVRAGSSFYGSDGVVAQVAKIHQHPSYNPYDIDNDISVLELADDLELTDKIQPAGLPVENEELEDGVLANVSGWGATREGGSIARQLQVVRVGIVNNEECAEKYKGYTISSQMLCAGHPKGGKDACQGDSGGPLVIDDKLTGVVSWGYGCARPDYPGVYASVPALRSYVKQITGL